MKKLLFTLALLLFSTAGMSLPKVIHFATEATYPPFEYVDASGQIKGFDIDVAKEVCKRSGVQCTFSNQPWDSLIPGLKLGKFDALISAMAITDVRKKQVDFTNPYLESTAIFIAPKNSHLTLDPSSLKNKTIGVQGGTTFAQYLKAHYGNQVKIKEYTGIQDVLLDLHSGRVDGVIGDTPVLLQWLNVKDNQGFAQVGNVIQSPEFFGSGYGIAVQKDNTELLTAFNNALTQMKQEGMLKKESEQFFGH